MRYNGIIVFLGALTLAFSAGAQSLRDSLSADGPFILHRADGVRIIRVDAAGNISDKHLARLPENYRFEVTDHRGKLPFEVTLRPFERENWHIAEDARCTLVMSDPHGRLDCVVSLLQGNGVIDGDLHWSYGSDRLVVIGDIFDRGNDVTAIFWLLYKLQQEAAEAGGSVVLFLGNHEPMVFAIASASAREWALPERGMSRPMSRIASLKRLRSSARSIASAFAPMSSTR